VIVIFSFILKEHVENIFLSIYKLDVLRNIEKKIKIQSPECEEENKI